MHTRREEIMMALQESYFTLVDVNEFKVGVRHVDVHVLTTRTRAPTTS